MQWKALQQAVSTQQQPTTKLNLWVCTIGGGTVTQFPGGASSTDGVAIDSKYIEILNSRLSLQLRKNSYSRSRTLDELTPHLGDANCGSDLLVIHLHTILQITVYRLTRHYSTCSGNPIENMTMNYMDYTDDRGMFMFQIWSKVEWGNLLSGGSRASFRL
jgi:hypothetical protein